MSNEELKKKFFDECTTNTTNRITELHGYLPVFNMKPETLWSWIEANCLQKQQEDKVLSIKKHINECLEHYQALGKLGQLMEYENTCNDAYKSILNKIVEIESNSK